MSNLDLSVDEDLLPAFVIGYDGARSLPEDAPEWLHTVQHQYAGYACTQWEATGCVIPLGLNHREGTGKVWLLTRALVELGESWPGDRVYDAPEVAGLVAEIARLIQQPTGVALDARGVQGLAEQVTRHLAFPGLTPPTVESGDEALLRFREADPSPFFDGWRMACGCAAHPGAWHAWLRYGREIGRELQSGIGRGEPPRIFLLWENSD